MLTPRAAAKWLSFARQSLAFVFVGVVSTHAGVATNPVEVIVIQGTVEVARAGQAVWDPASTQLPYRRLNPGDQIRTKDRSRTTIRLSDLTLVELGPNAHLELLRPADRRPGFSLARGLLHLFHRDKPGEYYFRTPTASPVIRGTEFNLEVADDGATTLDLLEGEVALTNDFGALDLNSGEAALVQPARAPARIAAREAVNVIQWCLYYPAVLDLNELRLSAEEQNLLANSLAAYRLGDLPAALTKYPTARQPSSDPEKVYLAALLLSVGEVGQAEALMKSLSGADQRAMQLATALRTLIAAVKFQPLPAAVTIFKAPPPASSLLAESYYRQSRFELEAALESARAAVTWSPNFAFGWARLADLEFSFGRTREALDAANRALELSPRQAQAQALKGFLLAAQNHTAAALGQFDEAIALNGELGNAWLGRGLCLIRQGRTREGIADLLVAAAQEPNRALLRSYLGKGFGDTGTEARALRELNYAKQLDPHDPTAWLYSALLNQQLNQVNDAIRDLEHSKELNDNRQLYRSRLLLDEDLAVREANLAAVYQDAGLFDQSVREASRAVSSDYANPSAHLFLANSYAQLGTANSSVNLRYETVTLSEYLMAQLLAPVGGSALSPYVSQQEYSPLFQRDGFGVASSTAYLSTGNWWERGAQYGTFGNFGYSLDAYYASQDGERPNNDSEQLTLSAAVKFQIGPQDSVFVQVVGSHFESGDLRQYYYQTNADPNLRIEETQSPNVFVGYHHEWGPGAHTLLLVGRLQDDFQLQDSSVFIPTLRSDANGVFGSLFPAFSQFSNTQSTVFVAYSAELQQIWQRANNTLIVGGRFQNGENESEADLEKLPPTFGNLIYPSGTEQADTSLRRASVYAYDHWRVFDQFWLIGGVSYDWLSYPENIDLPPLSSGQTEKDQLSPKAGVIWLPTKEAVVRGAYTRSLGGLYYDNSVRLEPTQVAGFNQAFRSLIPESVAGLVAGAEFETAGLDFSLRLPTGTYLGVGGEWLQSEGTRNVGVFDSSVFTPVVVATNTPQQLDFTETSLTANINQLLGRDWSLGVRYRISKAELNQRLTEVPVSALSSALQEDSAVLQQLNLSAKFTHPSGFFAEVQGLFYSQNNQSLPDEQFWQLNVYVGYRFARRRAELLIGGLNLTDQDYQLNPVNLYAELPRERALLVGFKFNF